MPRLLSPDDKCVQVDVPFGGARRYSGRSIDVSDPAHVKALRRVGYTTADVSGAPVSRGGFECPACSFHSFFRLCGRCGSTCDRPDISA